MGGGVGIGKGWGRTGGEWRCWQETGKEGYLQGAERNKKREMLVPEEGRVSMLAEVRE